MKQVLLFDFDGVLVDSESFYGKLWRDLLKDYHLSFNEGDLIGKTNEQFLKQFNLDLAKIDNLIALKIMAETVFYKTEKMNPLLIQILGKLSLKYRMGIVSNNNQTNVQEFLTNNHCRNYFECLVTPEAGLPAKPAPDSYLKAFSFFTCEKEQVLIIEDSPIGFKAAENAGIDYILFNHHPLMQSIQTLENALS